MVADMSDKSNQANDENSDSPQKSTSKGSDVSHEDLFKRSKQQARKCNRLMRFCWHLRALLVKRLKVMRRDPAFMLCQLLLPIAFVLVFFLITQQLSA